MPNLLKTAPWAALIAATALLAPGASAAPPAEQLSLVPHRAVYDLKLLTSKSSRGIDAIRGRIVYDFSGSACEGYALDFRQVSELDSGEGKSALSDLRATTWEDGAAKKYRFNSENTLNRQAGDAVDGNAERKPDAVSVSLRKPKTKSFAIGAGVVFPTEHMRRILAAAVAGKKILEAQVYDGAETGEKLYNTLTVIGPPIAPGAMMPQDATAKIPAFAKLRRWPVSISYFEKDPKRERSGEQTPSYSIAFELYENGVSRALVLDYNDFVISGEMTALEMKNVKPCP